MILSFVVVNRDVVDKPLRGGMTNPHVLLYI
jgi:hypothetical protein